VEREVVQAAVCEAVAIVALVLNARDEVVLCQGGYTLVDLGATSQICYGDYKGRWHDFVVARALLYLCGA
jgi:hypothetical protein